MPENKIVPSSGCSSGAYERRSWRFAAGRANLFFRRPCGNPSVPAENQTAWPQL